MLVSSWSINKVHVSVHSFCTRDGLLGGSSALPMSFHVPHCIFCTTQHHLKTCLIFQKIFKHLAFGEQNKSLDSWRYDGDMLSLSAFL